MKKVVFLIILWVLAVGLITGVQANTRLTFQEANDFTSLVACTGTCSWVESPDGGNSYIQVTTAGSGMYFSSATPMTYAAATVVNGTGTWAVSLYDGSWNLMEGESGGWPASDLNKRIEMKMIGGSAYYYANGVEKSHSAALAQNPSYVVWGVPGGGTTDVGYDDVVWGSSQPLVANASDKYVFGMPPNGYFLMKDFLNPAASGFYYANQTDPTGPPTLVNSFQFISTYGKGSSDDEQLVLNEYGGGDYQVQQTNSLFANKSVFWNLTDFFATTAPYGLYVTTIDGSVSYSDILLYIGSGASVEFDKEHYATGETATATIIISDGYYDESAYDYHFVIKDIFGTEVSDVPTTFTSASPHTGYATYVWDTADGEGLYYGMIYATRLSDSEEILMNYDYCDLSSALYFYGYVKDAQTENAIVGATVNVTQGVIVNSVTSGAVGNYTTTVSTFTGDVPTTIEASAAGYDTYTHTFTPPHAGQIEVNITLMPSSPTHTGIALGGIVRTPPYNRTVDSATVTIQNGSYGTYTVTTNGAGFYIRDSMPDAYWWDVWGSKTGFSNSTTYFKYVTGV